MKTLVSLAACVALAGCISLGAKPPPSMLTLTSTAQPPVGQQQVAAVAPGTTASTLSVGGRAVATVTSQPLAAPSDAGSPSITVQVPAVPQELATPRVPVQATPTTVAYIKSALWVAPPAQGFARILGDTITARTGRVVLSGAQSFQTGSAQLTGELRMFGIDAASQSAVVIYDASLVRATGGGIAKQRFEARVPVATIDAAGAGTGLNAAANQVAAQVADWVGR
ncbi:ABC-type transport auxiliary lipoprotein family protein [Sphingomonas bacterium]|uniref:ABC-type transport auxiliary lipoprotein family protein n=1 Tax=Sphingomonas bacterium TaxID=1895847 RepID=UPI0015769475|nr:ABC-type transport auxiliary lipoprotein family protein [Sphingomonas bacterium]